MQAKVTFSDGFLEIKQRGSNSVIKRSFSNREVELKLPIRSVLRCFFGVKRLDDAWQRISEVEHV